ncbi:NAD(P)/FAD-dependent oxidoreductase [Undibacterium arcticum]
MAAELCHTVRSLAEYNVHSVEASQAVRIRLLESGERLLPHLNSELSQSAAAHLRRLGVQVCTTTTVVGVDADSVHDSSGRRHDSNITVWVAGVEGQNICTRLGLSLNKAKQILVNNSLQTDLDPHVFAIGDCSSYVCPVRGRAVPPRAQVAHQQALFLARVLGRPGRDTLPHFRYRDYGSLVSIGKFAAVGVLMGAFWRRELLVGGRIARLLYQLLYQKHVLSLHGFSRMAVQMLAHWIRTKVTPPVKLH